MYSILKTAPANPFIASLEPVFDDADTPLKWLVLSHDDETVMRSLSDALGGESVAVLKLAGNDWDFQSRDLAEAMEWAFDHSDIENLVLVGCSQPDSADDESSLSTMQQYRSASNYDRLLAGVQQTGARNRELQMQFVSQVQQLASMKLVRQKGSSLSVSGLFYRKEDGVLLVYETTRDCFQPLLAMTC